MLGSHLRYVFGLLAVMTCLRTPPVAASLLWDNGSFAVDNAAEISLAVSADDFSLSSAHTLTALRFWASSFTGPFTAFNGTVGWAFYTNNAGKPGTIIESGFDSTPVLTNTGEVDDFNAEVIRVDITIGLVALAPETYWLALSEGQIGSAFDGSEVFWHLSGSQQGFPLRQDNNEQNPSAWNDLLTVPPGRDLAFQLFDATVTAPEPASLLLLGIGLIGLLGYRGLISGKRQ